MAARQTRRHAPSSVAKLDLVRLIHAFEVSNKAANKSPKTNAWYSSNLRQFKDFLIARGRSLAIDDIGLEEAREYVLYLQERKRYEGHPFTPRRDEGLSPLTVQAHVRTLKAFYAWLFDEGYIASNKLERLSRPKVPKRYVNVLGENEIRRILSCIHQDDAIGTRDMAMVVTLLDTGLRLAELVNLKEADARIEEGQLKVMGTFSQGCRHTLSHYRAVPPHGWEQADLAGNPSRSQNTGAQGRRDRGCCRAFLHPWDQGVSAG